MTSACAAIALAAARMHEAAEERARAEATAAEATAAELDELLRRPLRSRSGHSDCAFGGGSVLPSRGRRW